LLSAAMPGVLPRTPMRVEHGRLVLRLDGEVAARRRAPVQPQLARLIGREPGDGGLARRDWNIVSLLSVAAGSCPYASR